jgi:hypothetical protein
VHSPDRLPLHHRDGTALHLTPAGDPHAAAGVQVRPSVLRAASEATWTASVSGLLGYVRLFVVAAPELVERVALLDPPVSSLRLLPGARPTRGRR